MTVKSRISSIMGLIGPKQPELYALESRKSDIYNFVYTVAYTDKTNQHKHVDVNNISEFKQLLNEGEIYFSLYFTISKKTDFKVHFYDKTRCVSETLMPPRGPFSEKCNLDIRP